MVCLLLPKSIRPSNIWKKRGKPFWKDASNKVSWRNDAGSRQPLEHPGRKVGHPEGSYVSDLAERKKAIILCWRCQPRFDYKRAHYYKDERFPYVVGRCDGCREFMNHQAKLYIHESFLGEPGGRTKSGQCWTPM